MKIITFYDNEKFNKQNRDFCLACTNKIDYFIEVLNKKNINVEIVSPSMSHAGKWFYHNTKYNINKRTTVQLFATSGKRNVFSKIFNKVSLKLNLFFYLIRNVKQGELIQVYHSPFIIDVISLAKKLKKFKLLLEVEEIYSDVWNKKGLKEKELKYFQIADKYMFPTEMLNEKININNKPYVINYGTYKVEPQIVEKYNDGKVHCVYAGTFDSRKGGAINAVQIVKYLNEKYVMHIIGFGNKKDTENLIKIINESNKTNKCKIVYDGSKQGQDYIKYIQKCDIGFSTQNPEGEYNNTSFPSKILSYMSNGLPVLSISLPVLKDIKLDKNIILYNKIDKTILSLLNKFIFATDTRIEIEEMNIKFCFEYLLLLNM